MTGVPANAITLPLSTRYPPLFPAGNSLITASMPLPGSLHPIAIVVVTGDYSDTLATSSH